MSSYMHTKDELINARLSKSAVDVLMERHHQIYEDGRTLESDAEVNAHGELTWAAKGLLGRPEDMPKDWDQKVVKNMLGANYRETLVMSAALLLAEIDRVDGLRD